MNKKAEYDIQLQKEKIKQIKFNFNKINDKDILDHLANQKNRQGYIKELIRKDINKATN